MIAAPAALQKPSTEKSGTSHETMPIISTLTSRYAMPSVITISGIARNTTTGRTSELMAASARPAIT